MAKIPLSPFTMTHTHTHTHTHVRTHAQSPLGGVSPTKLQQFRFPYTTGLLLHEEDWVEYKISMESDMEVP